MISIDNVSFSYSPNKRVISNLNLIIAPRIWTIITGPEGSGKTTLGKLIKGLIKPQSGTISFGCADRITQDQIGYIAGDYSSSVVGITVLNDICFGMENLRLPQKEMQKRVQNVLSWTGLGGFENRLTQTLSGGEGQKLALASVLAIGVKVLILDECFSMLDNSSRRVIRDLINKLKDTLGLTVLEITNRSTDMGFAGNVIYMDSGQKVKIYRSPDEFLSSKLGTQWIMPQGGINSLLTLFANTDAFYVKQLLYLLKIDLI